MPANTYNAADTTSTKTEQFIQKARLKHGDRYDYSKVEYSGRRVSVVIICSEHGEFKQTPECHTQGRGCPKCGRIICENARRSDSSAFTNRAMVIHGGRYGYNKVDYRSSLIKVTIICPVHGEFNQRPNDHLRGKGCLQCKNDSERSDTQSFIKMAEAIHGRLYGYSLVCYKDSRSPVMIICPKHGEFNQVAHSHLRGFGCEQCGRERNAFITSIVRPGAGGYNKAIFDRKPDLANINGLLYVLVLETSGHEIVKVGITKRSWKARSRAFTGYNVRCIAGAKGTLGQLYEMEQRIKDEFYNHREEPPIKFDGHTECFAMDVLPAICEYLAAIGPGFADAQYQPIAYSTALRSQPDSTASTDMKAYRNLAV